MLDKHFVYEMVSVLKLSKTIAVYLTNNDVNDTSDNGEYGSPAHQGVVSHVKRAEHLL